MISVIVPIYNAEKTINRCIDSILNQTYKDYELILINDESTDNSLRLISVYKDDRVKIHTKSNGGPASSRNLGIDIAKGDYITFIDSDDYIESTYLETLVSLFKKDDINVTMCSYINEFPDCSNNVDIIEGTYKRDDVMPRLFGKGSIPYVVCWGKLFKKDIFDDIRFKNVSSAEDEYLMTDIFLKINEINIINEPLYHYVQQDNYISKSVNKSLNGSNALFDRYKLYKKMKMKKDILNLCLEYSFNYYYEFINNPDRDIKCQGVVKRFFQLFCRLPINAMGTRNRNYLIKCLFIYLFK